MNNSLVERGFNRFISILNMLGSIYIFFLMLVIVRDVVGRVFFHNAMVGTPEIVANSLVTILFLQITYVLHERRHVRATILYDVLPYRFRCALDILTYLIGAILFILVIYSGWNLFWTAVEIKEYEGEGGFHFYTAPVRFMVLFGSLLMTIKFILLIVEKIKEIIFYNKNNEGGVE